MTKRAGSTISYTSYNLPSGISAGGNSSTLSYGAFRNRYKQVAVSAGAGETTIYVAGLLEKVTRGSLVEYRHLIAGSNGTAAIHTRRSGGTPASDTVYMHTDHLGSPELFTSSSGGVLVRPSFAAYGDRRDGNDWLGLPTSGDLTAIGNITRHGFTGHEHLDAVNLVHMNGRVFDHAAGRFLSRDPFIDGFSSSQGSNGYAYVHNNPLTFIDPSGLVCRDDRGEHDGPNFPDLEVCGERDRPDPIGPPPSQPPRVDRTRGPVRVKDIEKIDCRFDAERAGLARLNPQDPNNLIESTYPATSNADTLGAVFIRQREQLFIADFTTRTVHEFRTFQIQVGGRFSVSESWSGGPGNRDLITTSGSELAGLSWSAGFAFIVGGGGSFSLDLSTFTTYLGLGLDTGVSAGGGWTEFIGSWPLGEGPNDYKVEMRDFYNAMYYNHC